MSLIHYILIVISIINLFLGISVFKKGESTIARKNFAYLCFSGSLWTLFILIFMTSKVYAYLRISSVLVYIFGFLASYYFFRFSFLFPNKKKISRMINLFSSFFVLLIVLVVSFTNLILEDVVIGDINGVGFGPLYLLYSVVMFLFFSLGFFILLLKIKKEKPAVKIQIKYILSGSIPMSILTLYTNIYLFGLGIFKYNWLGPLFTLILSTTIFSAIAKHQFMDIKFVLRKSSVYLFSVSVVLLLATGLKYVFSIFIPSTDLVDELVIIFVIIIIFPYIREYFSYISNKYFFASLYNAQEVIARFSERLSNILEIEKLLESIASEINKTFYPKSSAIFLFNEKDSKYYAAFSAGDSFRKRSSFDLKNNPLDKYIKNKNILSMEEIKESSLDDYKKIQKTFLNNNIRIIAPLNIKDRDIGLFLLGEKESEEAYNNEDISLLQILATQSAFALDNSLKFEEAKNFNILLEREVEKAVMDLRLANEELRKLDTAKSDFISIASHQLRTPLTVIKGYVSMILEGNFGELPDIARDPVEKIYDSNEKLIKLVEQLLSISRIESGRIKYDFEEANLSDIITGIMESIRYSAIKKGLDLSYSPPKGFDPIVKIDTTKMRQVISSLIDNSIKYTYRTEEKRGFILIRLEDISEGDRIRFIVEDNGMGIREEDKPNLFKKFSRGENMSTVYTEGTGLGLYVAKQIIEAHNGSIYAESKGRDLGTKIYFDLPKVIKD